MSRFNKHLNRVPKDRKTLVLFYAFFSAAWCAWIIAYTLGYWNKITEAGGHVGFLQYVFYAIALAAPLVVIWLPIYITKNMRVEVSQDGQPVGRVDGAILAPEQVREINIRLEALAEENVSVKAALGDILATTATLADRPLPMQLKGPDLDAPNLPLTERSGDHQALALSDVAVSLDFSDQIQKGDWQISFEKLTAKGGFMELMKAAEAVIDGIEGEGIYVEDVAMDDIDDGAWRALAKQKRNDMTLKLEAIKDRSVEALLRSRLKNDPEFHEVALRFQKRFLEVVEQYGSNGTPEEFVKLAKSRAGRAFIILGTISGTFKAKS